MDLINYSGLDEISKKYSLVLTALDNQKALVVQSSIEPSLKVLKAELDDLGDPFLSSLVAQHLKAKDDEYLVDSKIRQYLETFIDELAEELRAIYNAVRQLEGTRKYQARVKVENDEEGARAEIAIPPVVEEEEEVKTPVAKPKPKAEEMTNTDKEKLVQAAYINMPVGSRSSSQLAKYIQNNYGVEVKRRMIVYICNKLGLKLEGRGGSPSHNEGGQPSEKGEQSSE